MTYSPLGPTDIRLLRLEPSPQTDETVYVSLEVHNLRAAPRYRCLSYTWGKTEDTVALSINNHIMHITPNLHHAIQAVRDPAHPIRLWIDKICINQDDSTERSQQVKLMRAIYTQAETVQIWLGNAFPGVEEAMDLLRVLAHDPSALHRSVVEDDDSDEPRIRSITRLFQSPWWSRLWVIQEALLAQRALVHCGHVSIMFDTVVQAFENIWNEIIHRGGTIRRLSGGQHMELLTRRLELTIRRMHRIHDFVFVQQPDGRRIPRHNKALIPFLLHYCAWSQCSDPRDKIYGTLGLANYPLLIPDYSLPVATVYARSAFAIMRSSQDLVLLTQKVNGLPSKLGLPSWVPDWTMPAARSAHFLVFHTLYNACDGEKVEIELHDDAVLETDALDLDEVDKVGPMYDTEHMKIFSKLPGILKPTLLQWLALCKRQSTTRKLDPLVVPQNENPYLPLSDQDLDKHNRQNIALIGSTWSGSARPIIHNYSGSNGPGNLHGPPSYHASPEPNAQSARSPLYRDADYGRESQGAHLRARRESTHAPLYRDVGYLSAQGSHGIPTASMQQQSMRAPLYRDLDYKLCQNPDPVQRARALRQRQRKLAQYRQQIQSAEQQERQREADRNLKLQRSSHAELQTVTSPGVKRTVYLSYDTSSHTYVNRQPSAPLSVDPPSRDRKSSPDIIPALETISGADFPDRFWRTLIMNVVDRPNQTGYFSCLSADGSRFQEWWDCMVQEQDEDEISAPRSDVSMSDAPVKHIPQLHWHLDTVLQHKTLFLTKKGQVGLADRAIRKGDRVFVLKGGRMPFVMRRKSENEKDYELVAPVYVHGIMNGEAAKAARGRNEPFERVRIV